MDPSEIEDPDKREDNDFPSGRKLEGDIESIDIVTLAGGAILRATGGIQHHRTRAGTWNNSEHDVPLLGKLRFNFEPTDFGDVFKDLRGMGPYYVEIALEKEGPEDPNRSNETKDRKILGDTVERIKKLYEVAVENPSLLNAIIDVAQRPFSRQSKKGIDIANDVLDRNNVRVEDLRIGTITTFQGWNHTIRNVRFFIGPKFILAMYGPVEGGDWRTKDSLRLHHLTLLDSQISDRLERAVLAGLPTEEYTEELFKEIVRSIVGQSIWCIDVASREGVAMAERLVFRDVALDRRKQTPMGPYWDDIAGVGAAVFRIVEAEHTLRNRFVRDSDENLPFTKEMKNRCDELRGRIGEVRGEIREHYHLLGAISQQQQVNRLQTSSAQDRIFQVSVGSLATIVGISSLVVAIYAASQSIAGVPGPTPATFGSVAIISFGVIGVFSALVLVLMGFVRFGMWLESRRAKPLRGGGGEYKRPPSWWKRLFGRSSE